MSAHSHSGWITVGALADGFAPDNHVLPACGDLAGLERVLHFANGWVIEHAFDSQRLRWRLADGSASGESDYRASSLRENLYLVDFLKQENGLAGLGQPGAGLRQPGVHRGARPSARPHGLRTGSVLPGPGRPGN